jgi:predicted TIM-barrel fold metal-dependent hydrolase
MYELDIVSNAVFCETEEDLAFVDSMGKNAPVWWAEYNDPDVEKLRYYHQRYHIRGIKKHNWPLFNAEFQKDSVEFPLGSGKVQPVSVEWIVSPEWMRFYAVCEELDLPIIWHTNHRYGGSDYSFGGDKSKYWEALPYDNEYVLSLIERILDKYPELNIILCHQGYMGYSKLTTLFEKHPNLYIDTSIGFLLHDGDYLTDSERSLIRPFFIRWADRILYGSDANYWPRNPTPLTEHEIRRYVYNLIHPSKRFVQQLYLPQPVLSKVAHENFERLFKMKG